MSRNRVDLSDEKVFWDLGASQSYSEYLRLATLLASQQPNSLEHDEMLFITVHQVSELWMKLMLHEVAGVFECVRRDSLDPSFKMLGRISRIQAQLLATWEVLSTMTPADYSAFRNSLGRASGFQSEQYRLLEFQFGNKNRDRYDNEVFYTDLWLGKLLTWAREQQWWKDTVVIISADHGEAFGEHGFYKHAFEIWDVLTRVPLLVSGPGIKPRRIDEHLYKERHLVECCIGKLKHFRRVFSRFDKLAKNYLSFVYFASTIVWLR